MKNHNNIIKALALFFAAVSLTSCYEDFVKDFGHAGVYIAYQYDLRTFVIGETDEVKMPVALGGVMDNKEDRAVRVSIDDSLLVKDISAIIPVAESFRAIDGLLGNAPVGLASGDYVSTEVKAAGLKEITPMPAEYYATVGVQDMKIAKGRHTASFTVKRTDALLSDPNAFAPYYAIAYKIDKADADSVIAEKSFAIVALKCENRFYGYWRRSGVVVSYDADGNEIDRQRAGDSWTDANAYYLSTKDAKTVVSNKVAAASEEMELVFDGNDVILSSASGNVSGTGKFNGSKLLQGRELYLTYKVTDGDGSYKEVSDTLRFRNRIRDGVSEWQDENPENYD